LSHVGAVATHEGLTLPCGRLSANSTPLLPALAGTGLGLGVRRIGTTVGTGSLVRKSTRSLFTRSGFSWVRKCEVPGTIASSAFGSAPYMSIMCWGVTKSSSENITRDWWVTLTSSDACRFGSTAAISPTLAATTLKWSMPSGDTSP
jgi:hypothetical protein